MKPAVFALAFVVAGMAACAAQRDTAPMPPELAGRPSETADRPCPAAPGPTLLIKRLASSQRPKIDGTLTSSEWSQDLLILNPSTVQEWKQIRGYQPQIIGTNDFQMSIWMAHDDVSWSIAAKVSDDIFMFGPTDYPYSGDALELTFAGAHVDLGFDTNALKGRAPGQRALLQLQVPPASSHTLPALVADWRTDLALKQHLVQESGGLAVRSSVRGGTWTSEIAIPFSVFDADALQRIKSGQPTKLGIDYLDYDTRIAERSVADNWGFKPDNVWALDPAEENVNIPKCMRPVVFESQQ